MGIVRFKRPWKDRRRGAACVELAICLPIMVALVLGSIEACNMIYSQQALHVGAYEAARVAIQPDRTSADAIQAANNVLASQGVNSATVRLSPTEVNGLNPGRQVTVTVTATINANRISPTFFFTRRNLRAVCVMVKE